MGIVLRQGGQWRARLWGMLILALCLAGCKGVAATSTASVQPNGPPDHTAGSFTPYTIPTSGSSPEAIAMGPDGNVWFTEFSRARVSYVTPQGAIREFGFPGSDATAALFALAVGPDNNLWFTNYSLGKIGYVTTAGKFRQFKLSSPYARPVGIAAGPDGNLWFTESAATINGQIVPAIGRMTTSGTLTEFPIPNLAGGTATAPTSVPQMIVSGPDGKLWFTDAGTNAVASITTAGDMVSYPIPTANSRPITIIAGKDNDVWFAEQNAIGHLSSKTGKITEYPLPTVGTGMRGLTLGPDGNIWCTQSGANTLSKLTLPEGSFTAYPLDGNGEQPNQIVSGPDGLLWFTAPGSNSIDAFALP